jgi:hypothetical protein
MEHLPHSPPAYTNEDLLWSFGNLLVCIAELMTGKKPVLCVAGKDGRMHWLKFDLAEHKVIWEEAETGQRVHQVQELGTRFPGQYTPCSSSQSPS